MVAAKVRFFMLTEDSGSESHATWTALLRRMCRLVDPSCNTQPTVFAVEQPEQGVRKVMAGNNWRSRSRLDHAKRVHFWKTIADRLEEAVVVAFHVDGDVVWSRRDTSPNVRDVREIARRRVRDALEYRGRPAHEIEERLAYFIPLHPFREIEAWLFHNYDTIHQKCQGRGFTAPPCVEAWRARPELLDELERPKAAIPFGSEHNCDLAESSFPAARVFELRSSFAVAVEALRACAPLCSDLRSTYSPDIWEQES